MTRRTPPVGGRSADTRIDPPAARPRRVPRRPAPAFLARLGEALSHRVRPTLHLAGGRQPAYGTFVCAGVAAGVVYALGLAAWRGLSLAVTASVAAAAVAAALALAFATRAAIGGERFTFYHYQLATLAAAGAGLAVLARPVLPYLDVIALALAVVQASGRIGCLMAGCCHGRPAGWGVRYGAAHADTGFPAALLGVPLLPVQALESLGNAALALAGGVLVIAGAPAGAALVLYLAGYATLRFATELARGDEERPYAGGLSEGQWTSLALVGMSTAALTTGWVDLGPAVSALSLVLLPTLGLAAAYLVRTARRGGGLLAPDHVAELAAVLRRLEARETGTGTRVEIGTTSRGLRLSLGEIPAAGLRQIGLSRTPAALRGAEARRLGSRLMALRDEHEGRLVAGHGGVWHLLTPAATRSGRGRTAR